MAHITFIESYNGVPPPATGLCSCIHPPSSYGGRSARYWARASILTYGPFLRRGCPGHFYRFELWTPRDLSYGIMILWYYGIMVLWYYGIMVLWCYGVMVLWCYGVMILWCYDIMVLWYYGISIWIYISLAATGKASAASVYNIRPPPTEVGAPATGRVLPFLPTVHSYGGDDPVLFISLKFHLREICLGISIWIYIFSRTATGGSERSERSERL